jgi:diguanylate cyclase (GGDEF)-like protein
MTDAGENAPQRQARLRRSTSAEAINVGLASALAGDRELDEMERRRVDEQQAARGPLFYSDVLYSLTHLYFPPATAKSLWDDILVHKHEMSSELRRNVRIVVATLDYLSNIRTAISSPTLISEAYVYEIATLSMRDGMTGLYNHSTFYELLELEFVSHRCNGSSVALILIDIDDFKTINDRFGHQEGDRVLVQLAGVLRAVAREADICCRFGGEEFAVIMPFTGVDAEALSLAERLRAAAARLTVDDGQERITISAGVALVSDATPSPRQLVELADRALYAAKAGGKNRVASAGAP